MPDGSTYTVKPGDTLDRIAKGVKPAAPADNKAKVPPAANPAPNQLGKPPVAGQKEAPAPFRKELDLDRMKQLSGTPAKPGKVDLSVNNPAMNPVNNTQPTAKESMERILSIIGSK
jgi:LysM repeat protein